MSGSIAKVGSTCKGVLYIVSTPIGNLDDISARAIHILNTVDKIAAEDTRHSMKLLQHYAINTAMISMHAHNEAGRTQQLIELLNQGQSIALISDAGTPLISDPGYPLVAQARAQSIRVVPIPGCCALIAALSVAGLPTESFIFHGFLAAKTGQRQNQMRALQKEPRTLVFYESPHRINGFLRDACVIFGERQAVLARELTKQYETVLTGTLNELVEQLKADPNQQKGEFVVMIAGSEEEPSEAVTVEVDTLLKTLKAQMPLKQAVMIAVTLTGLHKNMLYQRALEL